MLGPELLANKLTVRDELPESCENFPAHDKGWHLQSETIRVLSICC